MPTTRDPPFAEHQETVKGSIDRAKLADLVGLSDDSFTIPPEAIEKTKAQLGGFAAVGENSPFNHQRV